MTINILSIEEVASNGRTVAQQRVLHVAYMTSYLDTMLFLGQIPEHSIEGVRNTIDSTRKAFDLPPLGLQKNPVTVGDHTPELVS